MLLRIIVASCLVVAATHAGLLPESVRDKRSPADGVIQKKVEGFTAFSVQQSSKAAANAKENFDKKSMEGVKIEEQGDRTQVQGQNNGAQVEVSNEKAIVKAITTVDMANDQVGAMMNVAEQNGAGGSGFNGNNGGGNGFNGNNGGGGGGK